MGLSARYFGSIYPYNMKRRTPETVVRRDLIKFNLCNKFNIINSHRLFMNNIKERSGYTIIRSFNNTIEHIRGHYTIVLINV